MLSHNLRRLLNFYIANHSSNQAFLHPSKTFADAMELLARGVYTRAKIHSFWNSSNLSNTTECWFEQFSWYHSRNFLYTWVIVFWLFLINNLSSWTSHSLWNLTVLSIYDRFWFLLQPFMLSFECHGSSLCTFELSQRCYMTFRIFFLIFFFSFSRNKFCIAFLFMTKFKKRKENMKEDNIFFLLFLEVSNLLNNYCSLTTLLALHLCLLCLKQEFWLPVSGEPPREG